MLIKRNVTEHLLAKQGSFIARFFVELVLLNRHKKNNYNNNQNQTVLTSTDPVLTVALTLLKNGYNWQSRFCCLLISSFSKEESGRNTALHIRTQNSPYNCVMAVVGKNCSLTHEPEEHKLDIAGCCWRER